MNTRYPAGTATKQFFSLLEKDFFFTVLTKKSKYSEIYCRRAASNETGMELFQQLGRSFLFKSCFRTKHN